MEKQDDQESQHSFYDNLISANTVTKYQRVLEVCQQILTITVIPEHAQETGEINNDIKKIIAVLEYLKTRVALLENEKPDWPESANNNLLDNSDYQAILDLIECEEKRTAEMYEARLRKLLSQQKKSLQRQRAGSFIGPRATQQPQPKPGEARPESVSAGQRPRGGSLIIVRPKTYDQ